MEITENIEFLHGRQEKCSDKKCGIEFWILKEDCDLYQDEEVLMGQCPKCQNNVVFATGDTGWQQWPESFVMKKSFFEILSSTKWMMGMVVTMWDEDSKKERRYWSSEYGNPNHSKNNVLWEEAHLGSLSKWPRELVE